MLVEAATSTVVARWPAVTGEVTAVAFSGDGTVLVAGSAGGALRAFDPAKLAPYATPALEMMADRALLEYSLTLALINSAAAPMLCEYP